MRHKHQGRKTNDDKKIKHNAFEQVTLYYYIEQIYITWSFKCEKLLSMQESQKHFA